MFCIILLYNIVYKVIDLMFSFFLIIIASMKFKIPLIFQEFFEKTIFLTNSPLYWVAINFEVLIDPLIFQIML